MARVLRKYLSRIICIHYMVWITIKLLRRLSRRFTCRRRLDIGIYVTEGLSDGIQSCVPM